MRGRSPAPGESLSCAVGPTERRLREMDKKAKNPKKPKQNKPKDKTAK